MLGRLHEAFISCIPFVTNSKLKIHSLMYQKLKNVQTHNKWKFSINKWKINDMNLRTTQAKIFISINKQCKYFVKKIIFVIEKFLIILQYLLTYFYRELKKKTKKHPHITWKCSLKICPLKFMQLKQWRLGLAHFF